MSEQRLNKIENRIEKMEHVFYKVEASLENIESNIKTALSVKDTVTTHVEKHSMHEARLKNLELHDSKTDDKVNGVNIKIALATGGWGVILFVGQYIVSNLK